MPDGNGTALSPRQEFEQQLDQQVQNFRALLPSHIPVEKFKRTVVVAVAQNPDLFRADRRSFFNAAQKCAGDGLLPDGREAAFVIFDTKVKDKLQDGTYQERWASLVQYMPMVQGIRKRMRNSGEVLSAEAHVVYRNDKFFQKFGDDPAIVHEPPAFGAERGEPVGAYAIIKLKNGEVLREVMDRTEIERVRNVSRAKDGPAWKGWWAEMARKTVLRRCAKAAPSSADIDMVMARDDEPPETPTLTELPPGDPEPPRQIGTAPQPEQASYIVVDFDTDEHEYATAESVERALELIWQEAKKRGRPALDAARENNEPTLDQMRNDGHGIVVERILDSWNDHWTHANERASADKPSKRSPAGENRPAPAGERGSSDPRLWPERFAALAPQPFDVAGDELDWTGYADAAVALIGEATQAEASQYRTADNPHLQKLRREDGDQFRRIATALAERSKAAA
jgi:phage RecT family recombinase